jgi:glycerol-3-phosphate acyltransferase PlsY
MMINGITVGAFGCAYLLGSVPFGYLIGRFNGLDIRKQGSGNIGATNVSRVVGKPWGVFCFVLDFLKGLLPVVAGLVYVSQSQQAENGQTFLLPVAVGGAAVIGHIWPVFLGFKGGKGMATMIGVSLALAPLPVLIGVAGWLVVFKVGRIVSLASIVAAVLMPLAGLVLHLCGIRLAAIANLNQPVLVLMTVLAVIVVAKHHSNIARLIQGTEHRFVKKTHDNSSSQ